MIDYLLNFTDEASAKADPIIGGYWIPPTTLPGGGNAPGGWRGDVAVPNLQMWHPSQDTTKTVDSPFGQHDIIIHQYLPGFYLLIGLAQQDSALDNHKNMDLTTLRESGDDYADFVGRIAGRTLTVTSITDGVIATGMVVSGTGVRAGTKITSGGGLSWQVDLNQNVPAGTAMNGQQTYIIATTYTAAELQDLFTQPMFMGANYPYQRTNGKW